MHITPVTFAIALRIHRARLGLTQKVLAGRIGSIQSRVHLLENGIAPTEREVRRLAKVFAVDESELAALVSAQGGT